LFQPIVLLQPVRSAFTAIAELLVNYLVPFGSVGCRAARRLSVYIGLPSLDSVSLYQRYRQVRNNHIFVIFDPNLPVYYATFRGMIVIKGGL